MEAPTAHDLVTELLAALYGTQPTAQDRTPREVWEDALDKVASNRLSVERMGSHLLVHHACSMGKHDMELAREEWQATK